MTLATEWKFCSICFLSFICEYTHKVWYKNLWNWHVNDNWPFYLALMSPVWPYDENFTCHPRRFDIQHDHVWKKNILAPWAPPAPQSPTPGAWPREQKEIPVWYVLYLSFVRTHTKFGIKIFEIDFVIEIKWYLTFWPFPRAPGGGAKKSLTLHAPFLSVTHTPNLVEFRPMFSEEIS